MEQIKINVPVDHVKKSTTKVLVRSLNVPAEYMFEATDCIDQWLDKHTEGAFTLSERGLNINGETAIDGYLITCYLKGNEYVIDVYKHYVNYYVSCGE